jgi:predicted nucleotidyltransferase
VIHMENKIPELVEKLKKAYGDRLVSVVLYGSAAAGDHHAAFSDVNILCVLAAITPREMGESESIFRWWRELGNPAPLLLSAHEVETSTDCFPIEFHDITRQHRILYGADVVSALSVDNSFYRAQVEHELRAKLLRLRQKAAGMLSDKDLLRRLLADSLSTFCVLFRHALMLHGMDAKMKKREVIEQTREAFGIDAGPFLKLLDLREEKIKPKEVDPLAVLGSYLKEISAVIDRVDTLAK